MIFFWLAKNLFPHDNRKNYVVQPMIACRRKKSQMHQP